ncbi:MAG: YkvA family protein [Syntrophobacteraceae bacterium]
MSEQSEASEQKLPLGQRLRNWARILKRDIMALYLAMKHPETPMYAKIAAAVVVGYALSPVDLIPDFIPVLGYLDDVILLPLGIALVIKLIPCEVLDSCRRDVVENPSLGRPKAWVTAFIIVGCWGLVAYWAYHALELGNFGAEAMGYLGIERLRDWGIEVIRNLGI